MSKKRKTNNILGAIETLLILYSFYFIVLWFLNKQDLKWMFAGLGVITIIFFIWFFVKTIKDKREMLMEKVYALGLDKDINEFIDRFGKEKSKKAWKYKEYGFNCDVITIFVKTFLSQKGLKLKKRKDFYYILKRFINERKEILAEDAFEKIL